MSAKCWSVGVFLVAIVSCSSQDRTAAKAEAIRRGDELVKAEKYAEAADAYQRAVNIDPQEGLPRLQLAKLYERAGNWDLAAREGIRAADLLPDNRDAQFLAARLMLAQGRFLDVSTRVPLLLSSDPTNVDALMLLANATAHLTNTTYALFVLADAVLDPYKYSAARRELRPNYAVADDVPAERLFRKAVALAPTSFDTRLALVNFLWAAGRAEESEALLKGLADENPGHVLSNQTLGALYLLHHRDAEGELCLKRAAMNVEYGRGARFMLADFYIRAKRDNDALSVLRAMPPADVSAAALALSIAKIEFRLGHVASATQSVDTVLKSEPYNAAALLLKAQFQLAARSVDGALESARAAVAADPKSGDAQAMLGEILFTKGDLENALAFYTEAFRLNPAAEDVPPKMARLALLLGRGEDAVQIAKDAKRRRPNDREITIMLARALVLTGKYAAAESELATLPPGDGASGSVQALLGTARAGLDNRSGARAAFTRALQSSPDSWEAISGLVLLDLDERNLRSARLRINRAVAAHPDDTRTLLLSARVSLAERDPARAEETMKKALTSDPSNLDAATSLAELLDRTGRHDAALHVMEQLLQRRPRSIDAQLTLGLLLEHAGKPDAAREQYEKILGQDRGTARAASRLAILYVDQKANLDVALTLAVEAKQLLPNDPEISDALGWVYTGRGDLAQGLPHLQDAVRLAPDIPRYRYHLGAAYLRAGERIKARAELAHALSVDAGFRDAGQARALLAESSP